MKVVKKYDMMQRNKVKRILTEREILATADHPFIVNLYYSFQSKHSLVFIMEYCAGGEFYRIIQRQPFRCLKGRILLTIFGLFSDPLLITRLAQNPMLVFMARRSCPPSNIYIRWASSTATSSPRMC